MQMFFWIFFFHIFRFIVSKKTEIKFNLNVPSLFRCKKNGPIYYFEKFPTYEIFHQTITNINQNCDLLLLPIEKRVIFDIKEHILQCRFSLTLIEKRLNEILIFKSNCSINNQHDLCIRLTPTNAIIITDYLKDTNEAMTIDLRIHGIGTQDIQIGNDEEYPYSRTKDGFMKRGVRRYHVVFKMKHDNYLNMMCRYTYMNNPKTKNDPCESYFSSFEKSIERRHGSTTSTGEGWSWLCYYYPLGAEEPLDYNMMNKAIDDLEKFNSTKYSNLEIVSFSDLLDSTNDNDSIISLKESTKNSWSQIYILVLVIILAIGLFYICRNKCQIEKNKFNFEQSSLESEDSIISNDNIDN